MNGYQTIAILVAIIMAASLGMIVYTTSGGPAAPAFPTKGTITFAGGEVAFDGLKSRSTINIEGSRFVYYEDGAAGTLTSVKYNVLHPSMVPAGENQEDYTEYISSETEPATKVAAAPTGSKVTGSFVSSKDGTDVYSYVIGSSAMTVSFKDGKITAIQSGDDGIDVTSYSTDVSGSLTFDKAAVEAAQVAVKAKYAATARRILLKKGDRETSSCNLWDAARAFFKSGGSYGNWCGKGQGWLCKGSKEKEVSISIPGHSGKKKYKVCKDTGFDETCCLHDHGRDSQDALGGLGTANYCEVDRQFKSNRKNKNSKSFSDNDGNTEYEGNTGAACLFGAMPCLRYEYHSYWGWCSKWWGGYPCRKKHWGYVTYNWHGGNYKSGGCRDGVCYASSAGH